MGVGRVGGEIAFLAAMTGLVDELNLHDAVQPLLNAQVLDLKHTGMEISISDDPEDLKDADILIFSAGTPRNPNIRTRADLLYANIPVAERCAGYLRDGFSGILVTITNPVDANNYYLQRETGIDRRRCIGFGGQLDSARFRLLLRERGIGGEAWVLGEHGERQVPLFSLLPDPIAPAFREEILECLRGASMPVIRGKGGTVFGPAYHIAHLLDAIINDRGAVLPCSCVLEGEYGADHCSMGVPAKIGKRGIEEICQWPLGEWERQELQRAAEFLADLSRRAYVR
ncbi:MAG: lactate dehydrogenase [Methanomicrobiaceae archaeon]|nr:lactate dehydrogenase [Methanomicrobiaceae archaeon]